MHTNGSSSTPATGRPVLVSVDEFLGPYPALIPTDYHPGQALTPRFRYEVLQRLHFNTVVLAAGNGRILRAVDGQVWLIDVAAGQVVAQQQVAPDADGLYAIDAPVGQWSEVEILWERHGECECGSCACPPVCAVCDEPVGGGHSARCVWPYGSAAWEQPAIAAVAAVLDAHRHRPGCTFVRRRPGPLFADGDNCAFCGEVGRTSHTLTRGDGTVEHHQRCRMCLHVWRAVS